MRSEVIVVGAGGHAKVCIELLRDMGESVAYCVGALDSLENCLGVPVLRGDENLNILRSEGFSRVFVAVGSNRLGSDSALSVSGRATNWSAPISPHADYFTKRNIGIRGGRDGGRSN